MTLAPPFLPHAELVCKAWLQAIPGLPGVAADLPADQASWAADGFVTYLGLGGRPDLDLPRRKPVFQIDCWAVSPTSGKPPWGKANQLAELIVAATFAPTGPLWGIRGVDLGANYHRARVMAAQVVSEPRRMRFDEGAFARFSLDVQLTWAVAG
ncbi:hypothetical protein ACIGG9_16025 [Pseudonocardia alni]|uniref:hypothetical protein n=1 Tax=Pseudonocardia alni TaxID=33907 RepID=UPI0033CE4402